MQVLKRWLGRLVDLGEAAGLDPEQFGFPRWASPLPDSVVEALHPGEKGKGGGGAAAPGGGQTPPGLGGGQTAPGFICPRDQIFKRPVFRKNKCVFSYFSLF